jgi:hypothetical protein
MVQRTARASRYLVELAAPEAGWSDVDRLIRLARENNAESVARFVRAIFLPEDSSFLLLYEATSPQEASAAASELQLGVERVSEVLTTEGSI